jgi:hypothetical protein
MAAVVFGCASEIPAVYAVAVPGAPVVGSFVDENSGSWWRKGGLVVVEGSIDSRRLMRDWRSRLSVVDAWSMSRHHRWSGKDGSVVASMATK